MNKGHYSGASRAALAAAVICAGAGLSILPANAGSGSQCGKASWYQLAGRTASGEMNNPNELTAAHRSLAFGAKVKVENLTNGRSVVVRINDRGPFVKSRVIDVSRAAAERLGFRRRGIARVRVTGLPGGKGC